MTDKQKALFVAKAVLKVIGLLGCLYFFICSLEIMSISFRLIGGVILKTKCDVFKIN